MSFTGFIVYLVGNVFCLFIGYQLAKYNLYLPLKESIERYDKMTEKYNVLCCRYDELVSDFNQLMKQYRNK